MANQTSSNILVALKRESTTGTAPATVTGADQLRIIDSQGLRLNRATIISQEKRADGNVAMGRTGAVSVDGNYNSELTVGGAVDDLIESLMRSTWTAADSDAFAGVFTSIAIASNVFTASGGSFITADYRVGQIIYLTAAEDTENNNKNLIVTAVTASTMTVISADGVALTDNAADTAGTFNRLKVLVTNTTSPTRRSYSVEQNDTDIDLSELFLGCRVVGLRLSFRPGQHAQATYTFQGMDRTALTTGTSPFYDTPSVTTGLSLIADDSSITYNGATVATFTGFDLNFQITAQGEPVIGSLVSPDIFDNDLSVSGSITGIRQDFSNLTLFDAETEFAVSIVLSEPNTTPPSAMAFYINRCKLSGLSAPVGGGDGAKIETLEIMAGPATAATGEDATVAVISSSGA